MECLISSSHPNILIIPVRQTKTTQRPNKTKVYRKIHRTFFNLIPLCELRQCLTNCNHVQSSKYQTKRLRLLYKIIKTRMQEVHKYLTLREEEIVLFSRSPRSFPCSSSGDRHHYSTVRRWLETFISFTMLLSIYNSCSQPTSSSYVMLLIHCNLIFSVSQSQFLSDTIRRDILLPD